MLSLKLVMYAVGGEVYVQDLNEDSRHSRPWGRGQRQVSANSTGSIAIYLDARIRHVNYYDALIVGDVVAVYCTFIFEKMSANSLVS